jgi:hypothetical protein
MFVYAEKLRECDSEVESSLEFAECHQYSVMHNLALQALANALQVFVNLKEEATLELDESSRFWRDISSALAFDLTDAHSRPQDAALAAKCIALLEDLNPESCGRMFVEDQMLPSLLEANEYGKVHHLALERESQKLIDKCNQ